MSGVAANKVSIAKTAMIMGKIVLGLGQVVSRQPDLQKEEYPGPQWDSNFLKLFFMGKNAHPLICVHVRR